MKKVEIMHGLKNAIQRGSSLEQARKSFINAGYNEGDVNEAARALQGSLSQYPELDSAHPSSLTTTSQQPQTPTTPPHQQPEQISQPQQTNQIKKPKKSKKKIIILIIILVLLLITLGAFFIFK
tara:strand:+ start:1162 stop:1533 length:372 start_codon:yes stop_codon:yes gene_type:complete